MANIMLTDICNLKCPYCFANEFVNHDSNEISIDNFERAINFITADGTGRVGLIGGEPTLHSRFKDILNILIADNRFGHVKLFTNGIHLAEFAEELSNPKMDIIINCNSPEDIGEANFRKIYDNLKLLITRYNMKDRITLGYNLYKTDQDFMYLLKLLREFHFHRVRMSVTVPNTESERECNEFEKQKEIINGLRNFVFEMIENHVIPHYDCNKVPECVWGADDRKKLDELFLRLPDEIKKQEMACDDISVFSSNVSCEPVIDIGTNLTAVRCFGLSSCTKENISDFKNLRDLRQYYIYKYDSIACNINVSSACKNCYSRKVMKCNGGCYAYSMKKTLELKEKIERIVEERNSV